MSGKQNLELLDNGTTTKAVKKHRNRPDLANFGQEYIEKGDNARYLRHALATYGLPPIDIADEKQVQERIDWYFNHCMEDDMKPTVNGLCNSLGISRDTIRSWYNGECRGSTHSDIIKKAYTILEALWEDYMMNGKINPAAGIFLGRNHWGYRDQIEVTVTPNNPLGDEQDHKALEQKVEDIVLDEGDVIVE